jgi:hypothetical protein
MMAATILAAVLAVLAIRALRVPQVRIGLAVAAGLTAGLAAAEGYAVVVLVLATVMTAGTLGPVALLHQHVVPARAAAGGAS